MLGVSASKAVVVLECEKQKDAAPFKPIRLRLVPTGGSCVVQFLDASSEVHAGTLSSGALKALRVLSERGSLRCKDWVNASSIREGTFYRYLKEELKSADLVMKEGDLYVLTEKGRAAVALTTK